MNSSRSPAQLAGWQPPRFEVADIFRDHAEDYVKHHPVTVDQLKVIREMVSCRTAALGGHLYCCDECGHEVSVYNSCRNRHCPLCLGVRQARWVEQRKDRTLPTHYFHVVFTMPQQMRLLAFSNRREVFDLLFKASSDTLLTLGEDPKRLGAQLGMTSVLHTWSRTLLWHPHVHCIVTGGGLDSPHQRWVPSRKDFLFPVRVMSSLFRAKLIEGLCALYEKRRLKLTGSCAHLSDPQEFQELKNELYREPWVVYCKRPFGGAQQIFDYLGRYVCRVGISNHRLRNVAHDHVTFSTKGGSTTTVTPHEFIQRFLQHVLPRGFQKIRHYGLLASTNVHTKLQTAFALLQPSEGVEESPPETSTPCAVDAETVEVWREQLYALTGLDLIACPCCRKGRMHPKPLPTDTS